MFLRCLVMQSTSPAVRSTQPARSPAAGLWIEAQAAARHPASGSWPGGRHLPGDPPAIRARPALSRAPGPFMAKWSTRCRAFPSPVGEPFSQAMFLGAHIQAPAGREHGSPSLKGGEAAFCKSNWRRKTKHSGKKEKKEGMGWILMLSAFIHFLIQ